MHPTPRTPGHRPTDSERSELLVHVERALVRGASTPAEVLAAVPDLGTWDTAKAYVESVRESWRTQADPDDLAEARGEMIATIAAARRRALAILDTAEKPAEVVRLIREIERLVRCESWLRGINSDEFGSKKAESDHPDPAEWIPDELEYLAQELENAGEGRYRDSLLELIKVLNEDLEAAVEKSKNPNSRAAPSPTVGEGGG